MKYDSRICFHFTLLFIVLFSQINSTSPEKMPDHLHKEYTLKGRIPVVSWYIDSSYSPSTPVFYSAEQIEQYMEKVKNREEFYYGATDNYLYAALDRYSHQINGKEVAVMGSTIPVYESMILVRNGFPTTIEYNKIVTDHPILKTITVEEYEQNPKKFDAILSISSYEHDGLGRYGDPLNPKGDLIAMQKTKKMLNKGGLLFLAVPVGMDCVFWNAHRVYGRLRFPLLIDGWEVVDTFGFSESDFKASYYHIHQPVFVLRPRD